MRKGLCAVSGDGGLTARTWSPMASLWVVFFCRQPRRVIAHGCGLTSPVPVYSGWMPASC